MSAGEHVGVPPGERKGPLWRRAGEQTIVGSIAPPHRTQERQVRVKDTVSWVSFWLILSFSG